MKTDLFQSHGYCWVFLICWHTECSTFTESSFRIQNSSARIPSKAVSLEKGVGNHFSILALSSPWTIWEGKKIPGLEVETLTGQGDHGRAGIKSWKRSCLRLSDNRTYLLVAMMLAELRFPAENSVWGSRMSGSKPRFHDREAHCVRHVPKTGTPP